MEVMDKIVDSIINPLILVIFAAGVFMFTWGLVIFLLNMNSPDKRSEGVQHMIYGVLGIFIMASVFGILGIIKSTFGI